MTKSMLFAALLALSAVPAALAADTASDRKATATPASTDEARALAGRQIIAQEKAENTLARACTCSRRDGNPESSSSERTRAGGQR